MSSKSWHLRSFLEFFKVIINVHAFPFSNFRNFSSQGLNPGNSIYDIMIYKYIADSIYYVSTNIFLTI